MQTIKNSTIYLGSGIINKLIPLLLLPILTKYLSPEEYGILSIYLIMITFYSAFVGMGIHTNVSKNFFQLQKDELAVLIGNIFYILCFTTLLYFVITYMLVLFFDSIFSIPSKWLLMIPFITMMVMTNEVNTTILRNEQRAYMFGLFEVSNMAIKMGITVLLLVVYSMSWYSQVLGILTSSALFFIIAIAYMRKREYLCIRYDPKKIRSILKISLPLIPHVVGSVVISMSDRIFIEQMVSLEAVGIYSVGYMFGMIVTLFAGAFIKSWTPWFYKNLSEPTDRKKEKIVKYTYVYIFSIFILSLILSVAGELILPYIVDEKFYAAGEYILWIALGYAVFGVYQIFFPYLVHISRTSFLAFSTVISSVLNLLFNYLLINEYGAIGAAYATILAFGVSAFLVFWYQSKNYPMPWL